MAAVTHLIDTGKVAPPKSLTILYADTRQELPLLQQAALRILNSLESRGYQTQVVLPQLDDRFYVYVLGRAPPSNTFRWCTPQLKIEPMHAGAGRPAGDGRAQGPDVDGRAPGNLPSVTSGSPSLCLGDLGSVGRWFQVVTPESLATPWRRCCTGACATSLTGCTSTTTATAGMDVRQPQCMARMTSAPAASAANLASRDKCPGTPDSSGRMGAPASTWRLPPLPS